MMKYFYPLHIDTKDPPAIGYIRWHCFHLNIPFKADKEEGPQIWLLVLEPRRMSNLDSYWSIMPWVTGERVT